MNTSQNINHWMQRTQRYWYEDGFPDMGFGGFLLIIGLFFLAEMLTPPGSPFWLVWGIGGPIVLIGGALLVNRMVRKLKERVTWPRTGYVGYQPRQGRSRMFRFATAAIVAAVVSAGMIVIQKHWLNWSVILGFVYLGALGFVAYRFGLWRYLVLALWALVLGLALAPTALTVEQSGAVFHIGMGTALLLAGWLTWRRYNSLAPSPQEAPDGNDS